MGGADQYWCSSSNVFVDDSLASNETCSDNKFLQLLRYASSTCTTRQKFVLAIIVTDSGHSVNITI